MCSFVLCLRVTVVAAAAAAVARPEIVQASRSDSSEFVVTDVFTRSKSVLNVARHNYPCDVPPFK